jgi:two-component system, chemotaxis family, chemotaxis protein CheY
VKTDHKTILIVDDASLVRMYYRSILQPVGFKVIEALNGLEALEAVLSTQVDMLIVDVNMPQMDGLTFVKTLRQKELPLGSLPVLITSTEAAQADFDAARAVGANFYLVKPIEPEILVDFAAMFCGIAR